MQANQEDHEHTEICDIKKLFHLCINRAKPKLMDQVTPPLLPLMGPNLTELHNRVKIFVGIIGRPYLEYASREWDP